MKVLQSAALHTVMITGDNIFTAIAVARSCHILSNSNRQQLIIDANGHDEIIVLNYHTGEVVVDIPLNQAIYCAEITLLRAFHPNRNGGSKRKHRVREDNNQSSNYSPLHTLEASIVSSNNTGAKKAVELSNTGRGLQTVHQQHPELIPFLIRYAKVFARTKPHEKKLIVEVLLTLPEFDAAAFAATFAMRNGDIVPSAASNNDKMKVIFCGDGANDMIALRAATVGISLCDAETSVAAPITSKIPTPAAVVAVILEGRCSLDTAYVLVLFNVMHGTTQLLMGCLLYYFGLIPGDYMYLQQDLFYTLVLGLAIS